MNSTYCTVHFSRIVLYSGFLAKCKFQEKLSVGSRQGVHSCPKKERWNHSRFKLRLNKFKCVVHCKLWNAGELYITRFDVDKYFSIRYVLRKCLKKIFPAGLFIIEKCTLHYFTRLFVLTPVFVGISVKVIYI